MNKLSLLPVAIAFTFLLPSGEALSKSQVTTQNPAIAAQSPIPNSLEEQAQQLYETGQYQEAIPLLEQAISNYSQNGDIIGQSNALRNLTLVYQSLGQWSQAKQTISESIQLLEQIPNSPARQQLEAQVLDAQGQLYLSLGQAEEALKIWQQSNTIYEEIEDLNGLTANQIYQVQALRTLGLYNQAAKTLTQVRKKIQIQPDNSIKVTALQYIGDVLRRVGKLKESKEVLAQSLTIAETLEDKTLIADSAMALGDTVRLLRDPYGAEDYYQRAIEESTLPDVKIQGQLNKLSLFVSVKEWEMAMALLPEIEDTLTTLPPGKTAINGRINLAKSLLKIRSGFRGFTGFTGLNVGQSQNLIANHLADAIQLARDLEDKTAESEAIGNLGTLYEQNQRFDEAEDLTEEALLVAVQINASDLAYQWQWQLGRILEVKGDRQGAIAAYSQSVNSLQSLRSDLVAISSEVQFGFRESVEPVYRELVALLLEPTQTENAELGMMNDELVANNSSFIIHHSSFQQRGVSQENLKQARDIIESLQLAELDNFFRDACLDAKPVTIEELDPTAAIFYSIVLPDRLEVIAALPGQPLRQITTNLPQQEIEQKLARARFDISDYRRSPRMEILQQINDWLITPVEAELANSNIKTLVFIPDGALRNIPMSVLHDGEQYLIEKYNVAVAPSLQLIDPQPLVRENLVALTAGLTEVRPHRPKLGALPGVKVELDSINDHVASQVLLNESFTESNFNIVLNASGYEVVHLATHGEFSSQAEDTFLLTWDDLININELNSIIRADSKQTNPIELLVLSACQTAVGDERAALGLAGVAVRAGARSTLASLWYVSDEATKDLMTYFYQELAEGNITKADALRQAQQQVLRDEEFQHPFYWSAFILLGNWL